MEPIIITQKFNCHIDKVWQALANETALKAWYFQVQNYQFEVGKEFTFYESSDSSDYLHQCKFLSIETNKVIEYTWAHPSHSKGSSVLKWELEAINENQTQVTLTHTGTENFADAGDSFSRANFEMGWNAIIKTMLRNYLMGIEKLKFEVTINASTNKVWDALWLPNNYKVWTTPFCEGSYYKGEIKLNERIHFLAPNGEGMYSDVIFCKENTVVVFKHIGIVKNFEEQPIDAETENWTGCFETYKLSFMNNETKVTAEVDAVNSHKDYMSKAFPLALTALKQLAESN